MGAALTARRPDLRSSGLQSVQPPMVIYTSEQAHRSVEKAAVILGVGLDNVRHIPTDDNFQMRPELLQSAIRADRRAGREPFCVVATAGTVATGAIDPIDAVADICCAESLWLHIDGAYGGLFVLSDRRRSLLRPCGRADSISLDPHKLLFAPLEAGCLLVRDHHALQAAFSFSSSYLTDAQDPQMVNYMDYGPQLSRDFKAFKVWCALQVFGTAAIQAAIDQTLDVAHYLADGVRSAPTLELLAPAPLTAVCFRLRGVDDAAHKAILTQLAEQGVALLGPVSLGGRIGLRACVTNYRTTYRDIDLIVDRIAWISGSAGSVSHGR